MSRIHLVSTEEASPEVSEIYEKALRGKPGNAQKALAHRPEMLKNFLSFYATVSRSLDANSASSLHPRLTHQRMPLLYSASRFLFKARGAQRR